MSPARLLVVVCVAACVATVLGKMALSADHEVLTWNAAASDLTIQRAPSTVQFPKPTSLIISTSDGKRIVVSLVDGSVKIDPSLTLDEASLWFWTALRKSYIACPTP